MGGLIYKYTNIHRPKKKRERGRMRNLIFAWCTVFMLIETAALQCSYLGADHNIGETFPALDGCNDCVCSVIGVVCTKAVCQLKPAISEAETPQTPAPETSSTSAPVGKSCTVSISGVPTTYTDGQTYTSPDGCNSCRCVNGLSMCTLMACPPDTSNKTCTDLVSGRQYATGDIFLSTDGCNKCQCGEAGLTCTQKSCDVGLCFDSTTGRLYGSNESFAAPDGCNTCVCDNRVITCTKSVC